jgi:hypothetical protein
VRAHDLVLRLLGVHLGHALHGTCGGGGRSR